MMWLSDSTFDETKYVSYCNMCDELDIQPVEYEKFDKDEYDKVSEIYFTFRKW